MDDRQLKFIGFVPSDHLEQVRAAVFAAGAGQIGDYTECSWSTTGTGTFRGGEGSDPAVGERGRFEEVEEIRFETVCPVRLGAAVAQAFVAAHPYEEPAYEFHVLETVDLDQTAASAGAGPDAAGNGQQTELRGDPQAVAAVADNHAGGSLPVQLWFDGGSRGNPGPAAAAWVLLDADGGEVDRSGHYLGSATNNVAEYNGLVEGLRRAIELGARDLQVFSDSELVVKQLNGQYRVRHADMKLLYEQARTLLGQLASWQVQHVRRADNAIADALVNETLDAEVGSSRR